MTILKDIKDCFTFLTRFPVGPNFDSYEDFAPKIWLFPIVGFVLGLISGLIGLILLKFLPFLLVGFIILGLLLFMTGAHHTDGLIDFGDGLMVMGPPERKIEAMHDVATGTGGFTLGFIVLVLTGLSISYSMNAILLALVMSEIGAKFGMVAACSLGKSAGTKTAESFIQLNNKKQLFFSFILSLILIGITIIILILFNVVFDEASHAKFLMVRSRTLSPIDLIQMFSIFIIFLIGTFLPLVIILKLSNQNFNGLTGDCLGALNEITRLFILILVLVLFALNII